MLGRTMPGAQMKTNRVRPLAVALGALSLLSPGAAWSQAAKAGSEPTAPPAQSPANSLIGDDQPETEVEPAVKVDRKKGKPEDKKAKLRFPGFAPSPPQVPDLQVFLRFQDPAYPKVDPDTPIIAPAGLFSALANGGPVKVNWSMTNGVQHAILDNLIAAGPRPSQRAKVFILSSNIANAFTNGDEIYMTSGLWDYLFALAEKDPEEGQQMLLFILAHEYGHVLMRHSQALSKSEQSYRTLGSLISTAGMVYMIAKGVSQDKTATYAEKQADMRKAEGAMIGAQLAGLILETEARHALYPAFRKETERDADMLAVDLANSFTQRTKKATDITMATRSLEYVREINKTQLARQAELVKASKTQVATSATAIGVLLPVALTSKDSEAALKEIGWLAALSFGGYLAQKYDERRRLEGVALYDAVDQRQRLMKAYFERYPNVTLPEVVQPPPPPVPVETAKPLPSKTAKASGKASGKAKPGVAKPTEPKLPPLPKGDPKKIFDFTAYQDEWKGDRAREAAVDKLAHGDVAGARIEIDKALASPIKGSPEVQDVAGRVASAENKPDLAIAHFLKVLAYRPMDSDLYLTIAERYLSKPDKVGALKTLDEGIKATGLPGRFLPMKITIYQHDDEKELVAKTLAECVALGDPVLSRLCNEKAAPPKIEDALEHSAGGQTPGGLLDEAKRALGLPGAPSPSPPAAPTSKKKT